tara:strand:- start:1017 stop:1928 length:912 start_codon:yes stop_codon:yes gene_type:complete
MKLEFGTGARFAKLNKIYAEDLINFAIDSGIKSFDCGVNYGNWQSQPFLGTLLKRFLMDKRSDFEISSKAGTHSKGLTHQKIFEANYIEEMIIKSIKDLNCFFLDHFFLHGPTQEDLNSPELINKLIFLKEKGLIKNIGINTHDIDVMRFINKSLSKDIDSVLIDYNLIQNDREDVINEFYSNRILVKVGTALCQGLLINSPTEIVKRSLSAFYAARLIFSKNTSKFIMPARNIRKYIRENHWDQRNEIPLSFVLNNKNVFKIPIGMLSRESIIKNLQIDKNPISEDITNSVLNWILNQNLES